MRKTHNNFFLKKRGRIDLYKCFCFFILLLFFLSGGNYITGQNEFKVDENIDPIDQALKKINLTRETSTYAFYTIRPEVLDPKLPELYFRYVRNPFKTPYYLAHFKQNFLEYENSLHDTLMNMTSIVGEGVSRGYKSEPLKPVEEISKKDDALFNSFLSCFEVKNVQISEEMAAKLKEEIKKIPKSLHQPTAFLIYVSAKCFVWREKAIKKCNRQILQTLYTDTFDVFFDTQKYIETIEGLLEKFDFKYLYCGALDLATAVERGVKEYKKYKQENKNREKFFFEFLTPLGWVSLSDDGPTTRTSDRHYLLIVDFSGDDYYENCASSTSIDFPVSVSIDLEGNDKYLHPEKEVPRGNSFGSGIFGYGYLWDCSGNDLYFGLNQSQGSSFFGVGVLIDEEGDDVYQGFGLCQASAMFGISLLIDKGGDDVYTSFIASQAFGFTKGHGLLVDYKGNDKYLCNDEKIVFPSAQNPKHNRSMSQGFGTGFRGDLGDGHSLPGGTGRLWDMEGDDTYFAGVFAQGAGFWDGVGMLVDSKGNDKYRGIWYVQGAGAHTSLGALMDEDGDDYYKATDQVAQGAGHDFTLGFFIDKSGNDIYESPRLSLGSGNDNGIGIFIDLKGNDEYRIQPSANVILGSYENSKKGTLREDMFTLGFFLDANGKDIYPERENISARNNSLWICALINPEYNLPCQKGVGIDGDFKKINLLLDVITKAK